MEVPTEDEERHIYEGKVPNDVENCYSKVPFLGPDEFDLVTNGDGVVVNLYNAQLGSSQKSTEV